MQTPLAKAMKQRDDLRVFYLVPPAKLKSPLTAQIPGAIPIHISSSRLWRYWHYFKLRGQFDLVMQSDYQPILPLSWLGREVVFINDENFCRRPKASFSNVKRLLPQILRYLFKN